MKKLIILAIILALSGCAGKKTGDTHDLENQASSENERYYDDSTSYSHDAYVGYRKAYVMSGAEIRTAGEMPVLDSTVQWVDEGGNIHVDIYARNFPAIGDTGMFYVIVTN